MNFSLYIAKRYIISKSKNTAITIISLFAIISVVLGTSALFIVLSVFSGLREYSIKFTNDFDPDLKVIPLTGKSFTLTSEEEKKIKQLNGVSLCSKIVEERVLFYFDGKEQVTYIKGIDGEFEKSNGISKNLFNGQWLQQGTYQAVIGYGISQKLSIGLFDFNNNLEVYVPKPGKGQIESEEQGFNKEYLIPVGIYALSEELDSKYVFVDLGLSQQLMGFKPNQITGIEIKTKPDSDNQAIINDIKKILADKVDVKTREELNSTLHKMLNSENIVVYLIFTLVIIVALFTLVGALIVIILEKKLNLKTLLNLGAEVKDLRKIFILQGIILTVLGGIAGLVLGVLIVFAQKKFELVVINENLAYPVDFEIKNLIIVFLTITVLGFIASLIASSKVNKKLLD